MKYLNLALIFLFLLAACTPATGPILKTQPPTSSTPRIISTQTPLAPTTALPTKPSTIPESTTTETSSAAVTALPTHSPVTSSPPQTTISKLSEMDLVYRSWTSPDGQWIAELLHAVPFEAGDFVGGREYLRLTVSKMDQSLNWVIIDEWSDMGLGASYPSHFQWSPDGRYAFFFSSGVADGCGTPFDTNLYRLDLTNGSLMDQTPYEHSRLGVMAISPDGSLLAYIGPYPFNSEIIFRDLESGQERKVKFEAPASKDWYVGPLLWSTQGEQLVFTLMINYCNQAGDQATSIVLVDVPPLTARTLITDDPRLLYAFKWPPSEQPVLADKDGQWWLLDIQTGSLSPAPPDEIGEARDTLVNFFDLLNRGYYTEAVELYGGSYDELIANNPDLDPQDRTGLIKNACEINGYQCLKVRNIVSEEVVSPVEYHFIVEFLDRDGNRFVLGPCCGATETEMPPVWQFPYTVKKVEGKFQVMESPVFVP